MKAIIVFDEDFGGESSTNFHIIEENEIEETVNSITSRNNLNKILFVGLVIKEVTLKPVSVVTKWKIG